MVIVIQIKLNNVPEIKAKANQAGNKKPPSNTVPAKTEGGKEGKGQLIKYHRVSSVKRKERKKTLDLLNEVETKSS